MIYVIYVDTQCRETTYRLLNVNFKRLTDSYYKDVTEDQLKALFGKGLVTGNVALKHGDIVGTNGSINRFSMRKGGRNKPLVILREFINYKGDTVGYLISNHEGMIKPLKKDLAIKAGLSNGFQNGKLVPKDKDDPKSGIFISSIIGEYPKVTVGVKRQKASVPQRKPFKSNNDSGNKKSDRFTDAQKAVIQRGIDANVNYSIYAYPEYSPEKMEELLKGLMDGLQVKYYAHPDFSVEAMEKIRLEMKNRFEVRPYANPKFNVNQMEQIRLGMEAGIDYTVYAKPELTAKEMDFYRTRLEAELWSEAVQANGRVVFKHNIF